MKPRNHNEIRLNSYVLDRKLLKRLSVRSERHEVKIMLKEMTK